MSIDAKAGTTTGVSLLGGGDSIMRVDDPKYARAHCDAVERVGTRLRLAIEVDEDEAFPDAALRVRQQADGLHGTARQIPLVVRDVVHRRLARLLASEAEVI